MNSNEAVIQSCLQAITNVQQELDQWSTRSRVEADVMHSHMTEFITRIRGQIQGDRVAQQGRFPQTPPRPLVSHSGTQSTPQRTPGSVGRAPGSKRSPITQREEERQHDDDAWNDITSHISREVGGATTPPGTPGADVTPTASPPCLEKRPTSNLFGTGSTQINFELLFQQLSQDDGTTAPPVVKEPSSADSWIVTASNGGAGGIVGLADPPRPVRPSISMDTILHFNGQNVMRHLQVVYADHGRPTVVRVENVEDTVMPPPLDPNTPCQVLVEFKRRRVLQYDSPCHIVPGEYAIVAGDRGDDLGLVIFSWYNTPSGVTASGLTGASVGKWIGLGIGKVVRAANAVEVSQLHGIQSELERRAVEVCQQRVHDFNLPMVIVDAEYQFDRKKLTFYYEAQQRLDFRELVRDLYRTFRARIWMEMVENA